MAYPARDGATLAGRQCQGEAVVKLRDFVLVNVLGAPIGLGIAWSCHPPVAPTPIEAAGDALYTAEMQACLDRGKAAHSRAVYATCANGVDARWADGGRP